MPHVYNSVKKDRESLENLLNKLDPPIIGTVQQPVPVTSPSGIPQVNPPSSTSARQITVDQPNAGMQPVKLFDFDPDAELRKAYKKANRKINSMVKHVVRPEYLDEDYIKEKMAMDVETLRDIYYQIRVNVAMQTSIVMQTANGNMTARMNEVFGQLTDKISALNNQLIDVENRIRKTYTDLVFEVMDRTGVNPAAPSNQLPGGEKKELVVSSSRDMISQMKEQRKKEMMEKKMKTEETRKEDSAEDAEYEEVN